MKNRLLRYRVRRNLAALKKMCAMVLAWVCKMVCKDTPVLMASNSFAKSGKTYALAAAMPFMAMPIQEVPLLSWTVAHETVNEQNNLIASTDEDLYLGLLNEDPYTSDQQRERDKYELNDTDWYSVSFEQVDGTSKCHFALHYDWIEKQGYESEKVVILNLPEQGINGPFRVTAIKHIIPQKKPSEDAGDGYDWKPVTALFEHQSNQVYNISFDNGESLGVTYQHPIFSTTANDWKLAGELEVWEKVLTYKGEAAVTGSQIQERPETVYNLEVKELHNFLVTESGVVVHNGCSLELLYDGFKHIIGNTGLKHIFRGEVKNGIASGVHHKSAIEAGTARIIQGTKTNIGPSGSSIYKAKVQIKDSQGNWITKTENDGYTTFYPDNLSEGEVMLKIEEAANNRVGDFIVNNGNVQKYIGKTDDNLEIFIVRYPQYNNNIKTAFLNYD